MAIYSHSKLSTFEQCPLKFKFRYIDKIPPEIEQTIEGFLGGQVHDILQWVYDEAMQGRQFELDEVIKRFAENWNRDYNKDIKIVKNEFNAEHYFNKGIRFLVNYYLKHAPFKDNTINTEKRIVFNLDINGKYKVQGYIDRLVHDKDTNIFEIHDYKTSASMKSQEELDKDRQLALYSLGIREIFDNVSDVHLIWHFLDHNKKIVSRRTDKQLEELRQEIIQLINKIESTTEFPPQPGVLCDWCEFQNYCSYKPESSYINRNCNRQGESQETL